MRTEAQCERARVAREYVDLLRSNGVENPGQEVGLRFNVARLFFEDEGTDNLLKEWLEGFKKELVKVD